MSGEYITQAQRVLFLLKSGGSLTPLEAFYAIGTMRLAAIIYDLRRAGHSIVMNWETNGRKRWGRYVLERLAPKEPGP